MQLEFKFSQSLASFLSKSIFLGQTWVPRYAAQVHKKEVYRKTYLLERNLTLSDITYVGTNYWIPTDNGQEVLNLRIGIGMTLIMSLVTSSIVTILVFATLCYHKIESLVKVSSNSTQYRLLQLQLLNSLVGQALIPAVLMLGPSSTAFVSPFFHEGSESIGALFGITISLYPALDPLPTMFVIKSYREAIFGWFSK